MDEIRGIYELYLTSLLDMGIPGLLQALQPASVDIHIQAYSGKAVAIDSYCWLHKGAYGCALELIEGRKTDL